MIFLKRIINDPLARFDLIDAVVQPPLIWSAQRLRNAARAVDRVGARAHDLNVQIARRGGAGRV